jgi:hypothetical protein
MSISYKSLTLYAGYSSFQYGIRVLQTHPLNPLTSSSRPHHAVLTKPHGAFALLGGFDTIYNGTGKSSSHIYAITLKGLVNLELP